MPTLYEQVHSQLFATGSCRFNTWYPVHLVHETDGREIDCLACYPSKGLIRLALPEPRGGYLGFRFNKKKELVEDGHWNSLNG